MLDLFCFIRRFLSSLFVCLSFTHSLFIFFICLSLSFLLSFFFSLSLTHTYYSTHTLYSLSLFFSQSLTLLSLTLLVSLYHINSTLFSKNGFKKEYFTTALNVSSSHYIFWLPIRRQRDFFIYWFKPERFAIKNQNYILSLHFWNLIILSVSANNKVFFKYRQMTLMVIKTCGFFALFTTN